MLSTKVRSALLVLGILVTIWWCAGLRVLRAPIAFASGITSQAYNLIQSGGSPLARRTTLNFSSGMSCVDSGGLSVCSVAASNNNQNQGKNKVQSTSVLLINDGCSAGDPCNIRSGGTVYTFTGSSTATITAGSGSGTAYVYMAADGTITVQHPTAAGLTMTCTSCTASQVTTPSFPAGSVPLYTVTIVSGQWTALNDVRGFLSNSTAGGSNAQNKNFSFTSQTSVAMVHNFGSTAVLVQCRDASSPPVVLIPDSIEYTDANTVTVTFANAQTGSCIINGSSGTWQLYTLTVKAAGSCTSGNKCWDINGADGADLAAATSQDVTLFTLPANGYVEDMRMKTVVAFTGASTAVATLGVTGNSSFFITVPNSYDLEAAVANTNFSPATGVLGLSATGNDTAATNDFLVGLTTTVNNIDQLDAGGSVNIWVKWSVLP